MNEGVAQGICLDEFQAQMRIRLKRGEEKYDDKSFLTDNIITDIKEELLDVANYAYLLYERIKRVEAGEQASDYLHFCRAADLTDDLNAELLIKIFNEYKICHRYNGREYHFCRKV